jgi:hypothetical protein
LIGFVNKQCFRQGIAGDLRGCVNV